MNTALGAKLGANRGGLSWTAVDRDGASDVRDQTVSTAVDLQGYRLEIYGSEG